MAYFNKAYDKYIAILCVGTEKRLHSQYVDDIFDEYSVYVFYDYLNEERPTLAQLQQCGFLPRLAMHGQNRGGGIGTLEWQYKFILYCYRFKLAKNSFEQSIEKLSCLAEHERFRSLFVRKNYSDITTDEWDLYQVFGPFFTEKIRLTLAGIDYDNLLDSNISNPTLHSKKEVSKLISQKVQEEIRKIELND